MNPLYRNVPLMSRLLMNYEFPLNWEDILRMINTAQKKRNYLLINELIAALALDNFLNDSHKLDPRDWLDYEIMQHLPIFRHEKIEMENNYAIAVQLNQNITDEVNP